MSQFFPSVDILKHSLNFHFENIRNVFSNISIIIPTFNKFSNFLNFFFSIIIVSGCSINSIRFSGVIKGRNILPKKCFITYVSLHLYLITRNFVFSFRWKLFLFFLFFFYLRFNVSFLFVDYFFIFFFEVSENMFFPVTNFALLVVADID